MIHLEDTAKITQLSLAYSFPKLIRILCSCQKYSHLFMKLLQLQPAWSGKNPIEFQNRLSSSYYFTASVIQLHFHNRLGDKWVGEVGAFYSLQHLLFATTSWNANSHLNAKSGNILIQNTIQDRLTNAQSIGKKNPKLLWLENFNIYLS